MKRKIVLTLSILSLGVFLSSPQFADTAVNESGHSHEETVLTNERVSSETFHTNERGMGYYWKCHTCDYNSAWHLLASTAVSAANKHAQQKNHVTSVFPN